MFSIGITTVTCTATDATGNQSMCSFDVTVADTTGPLITCPDDITLECTSPPAPRSCSPPAPATTPASGTVFPLGITTVSNVATDTDGNMSMCFFDVTVQDTTGPLITCPDDIVVTGLSGTVVDFVVTATDTCDPAPMIVCAPPSGSVFPMGLTLVTCTATDTGGNPSMCSFEIEVVPPLAVPAFGPGSLLLLGFLVSGVGMRLLRKRNR